MGALIARSRYRNPACRACCLIVLTSSISLGTDGEATVRGRAYRYRYVGEAGSYGLVGKPSPGMDRETPANGRARPFCIKKESADGRETLARARETLAGIQAKDILLQIKARRLQIGLCLSQINSCAMQINSLLLHARDVLSRINSSLHQNSFARVSGTVIMTQVIAILLQIGAAFYCAAPSR